MILKTTNGNDRIRKAKDSENRSGGSPGEPLRLKSRLTGNLAQWVRERDGACSCRRAVEWRAVMKLKDWDDREEKELGQEPESRGTQDAQDADFEDREPEEALPPLQPWAKAAIFMGLTVLAAVICAVLWHVTHPDKPEGGDRGSLAEASQPESDDSGQPPEAEGNPAQGEGAGEEPESDFAGAADSETPAEPESEPAENGTASSAPGASAPPDASKGPQNQPESPQPTAEPQPTVQPTPEPASRPQAGNPEAGEDDMRMTFMVVQESVTPKDAVNLRTMPTTTDDRNIVVKIQNGEALSRTGINNDTGWSRIDYNGQTLYAVSQYLTTDLNYKTPVAPTDPNRVTTADGTEVIFENCDDWITPKEYVNLRTEPSTLQENATVSCRLNYGEKAHRTGFSADFGWSRVEYGGQILYVVTSFVYTVPAE